MSSLVDFLQSTVKNSSISEISARLGQDEQTTSNAIDYALPMIIGALERSTARDSGAGLTMALTRKHDGSILDDVAGYIRNNDQTDGRGILGHIFGQNRDAAAMILGAQSGIGESKAASLMATLAPLLLGALGKAKTQQDLGAGDLRRLLSKESESLTKRTPTMMSAISGLLDTDGDGDTDLKDLFNHGKKGLGNLLR